MTLFGFDEFKKIEFIAALLDLVYRVWYLV